MWAETTEVKNKNMTSLKNKISSRKRKGTKTKNHSTTEGNDIQAVNSNQKLATNKKTQMNEPTRNPSFSRQNSSTSQKSTDEHKTKKNAGKDQRKSEVHLNNSVNDKPQSEVPHSYNDVTSINGEVDVTDFRYTSDTASPVMLRNNLNDSSGQFFKRNNTINDTFKRYSDSFVTQNNCTKFDGSSNVGEKTFTRAQSELFMKDMEGEEMKSDKKSRRLSDIFKYGALKNSNSYENIKNALKMLQTENCQSNSNTSDTPKEIIENTITCEKSQIEEENIKAKKDKTNKQISKQVEDAKASSKTTQSSSRTSLQAKKEEKQKKTDKEVKEKDSCNTSYLKRVKSKIYKNRNDNTITGSSILPTMPNIEENVKSDKKKKKKNGSEAKQNNVSSVGEGDAIELRKSASHFEFRLIRQTSNLERIRPRTFGLRPASSNVGISELVDNTASIFNVPVGKPKLEKSKSSSAINLSLLRTRRNKLLEQARKNCKSVQNEFEFIAFGALSNTGVQLSRKFGNQNLISNLSNLDLTKTVSEVEGETKPGQPVCRSSSDRRPDSVREESSKSSQEHQNHTDNETENANVDSTISLPAYTGNKKKSSTNINRSESVREQSEKRKQRRNISDPLHNTTKENDDLDQQGLSYHVHSGSSSNSSLSSSRSSESPSTSLDAVSRFPDSHPAGTGWDSDMDVEADPPDWQSSVPEEELAGLHPYEKKRQDVINEIFHTERSHVRNLRVLEHVFFKPLHSSKILKQDELNLVFPNLSELLEMHSQFNTSMKNKRKEGPIVKECGDLLLNMFDGTMGENFQRAAATFCERQQLALEFIKERRKKDSRFENFLSECEKNNLCRRLPLQGIIPTEMQRLSKYPLLLERLIDSVEKMKETDPEHMQAELNKLKQAHDRSKEILNHVNEAAKVAFNKARLEDLQKHLDTSMFEKTDHAIVNEFKNLDLTKYKLIHEGPMHLRRPNKQPLAVHVVLLEEAVILLQRDAERYVLKFFQAGTPNQQPLAPVMKTSSLIVRANAASKSSLFVVNTSTHSQMYDLVAKDSVERDLWFKHISDAAEAYNKREGKSKRSEPTPDADESETVQDLPSTKDVSERAEQVSEPTNGPSSEGITDNRLSEDEREKEQSENEGSTSADVNSGNNLTLKLTADDWPLVQPTEVHVAAPPVHTAEPVLTPIEQIRRKDEEVKKALLDKEALVADLLSIPRESYSVIADMASEEAHKNTCEPSELVLAAVYQTGQLLATINESLNISDADVVLATGGKHPSCASNEATVAEHKYTVPSVPVYRIQEIATTLSSQLTTLLSIVKQREEERERLRKELQRTREQLHEKCALHGPQPTEQNSISTEDVAQAGDLESIEESPSENTTD